jgi:hypothetical protein
MEKLSAMNAVDFDKFILKFVGAIRESPLLVLGYKILAL